MTRAVASCLTMAGSKRKSQSKGSLYQTIPSFSGDSDVNKLSQDMLSLPLAKTMRCWGGMLFVLAPGEAAFSSCVLGAAAAGVTCASAANVALAALLPCACD
jgi:hypothetical protein